jgi:CheY-like chemotaxis protein
MTDTRAAIADTLVRRPGSEAGAPQGNRDISMRILVAEDEPGLLDVLVRGLTESGYLVDAVDRGDDALQQLKFYEYDVAIIDWRMPGMAGVEVVAAARRLKRPTAIIMLTAMDRPPGSTRGRTTTWSSPSTSASCSRAFAPCSAGPAAWTSRCWRAAACASTRRAARSSSTGAP